MSWTVWVATLLAAREVIPGDDADLTQILRDPEARDALTRDADTGTSLAPLAGYIRASISPHRLAHWDEAAKRLLATGTEVRVAGDPDYPRLLAQCWDAPPFLFVSGALVERERVAIVGSRDASPDVLRATAAVAEAAALKGLEVVSGLAHGVDSAAHLGALRANGTTLAVMGTGIERVFPEENWELAIAIRNQGALISQFPPDAPGSSTSFLIRNHTIAGLTPISFVMAGKERSGSRNEAQAAVAYGRRVVFWEPALGDQRWARELVTAGRAEFFTQPDEVLERA